MRHTHPQNMILTYKNCASPSLALKVFARDVLLKVEMKEV